MQQNKTPEEIKAYNRMIMEIRNKVTWKTATFAERNILKMHDKKMKKAEKKAESHFVGK